MGRKSSSKQTPPDAPDPASKSSSSMPLIVGAVVVIAAIGGLFLFNSGNAASGEPAASSAAAPAATTTPPSAIERATLQVTEADQKRADLIASLGPHKQKNLPPIPFQGYPPPRPPEVVAAAFQFAAEHPEVLSYMPCFCGCERSGHKGNHDCFVKSRAANGDVLEWDEHGLECAVCIDVATKSRQMFTSGASVKDIRVAIEKEFAQAVTMTPTGQPPAHSH